MPRRLSSSLTSFITFMPSSLGIMMSRTTTSGFLARIDSRPSIPSPAVRTSNPSDSKLNWSIRRTTGSSSTMRTLASGMLKRYPLSAATSSLPAAPRALCDARAVALPQVLEPGQAVVEASRAVAGEPQLAVALDERLQIGRQLLATGVGHRGQPAVALQAGPGVPAHERHQGGPGAQLVEDEGAVGALRSGSPQAFDGVAQGLLDAEQVVDREPLAERAPQLQLRPVQVHGEHRHVPDLRCDAEVGVA